MNMTEFDQYYVEAEPPLRDALKVFRDTHIEKILTYKQHQWAYYDIGSSNDHVIIWLVGGLRMADAAFRSIPMMKTDFRIIAPSYPSTGTMAELADGLFAILKAEKVKKCSVLAGSFGGMLAQVFVRGHSKHVNKVILSTTTTPDPMQVERYQQQLDMIKTASEQLVRETAKTQMYGMINPPDTEANFWKAYLDELYTERLSKNDLISTYHCIIDYMTNHSFQSSDLEKWHGEILILDSDDDKVFDSSARENVNAIYPQAHSHTFTNAGHSPASSQRDVYFEIVRKFLHE
jgi:pimeloyl-ACP methyl ester carboxylesterase